MFDPERIARFDSGMGSLLEDYAFLYGWVFLFKPARIAEIGTNHGVSSIVMAQALEDSGADGHIYTVDVSEDAIRVAERQIVESGLGARITTIHGDVGSLPKGRFDMAFIDGNHSYQFVKRDLDALNLRSSLVMVHDATQYPEVRKAAEESRGKGLLVDPPKGRQFSEGRIVATTSPGWYILFPEDGAVIDVQETSSIDGEENSRRLNDQHAGQDMGLSKESESS